MPTPKPLLLGVNGKSNALVGTSSGQIPTWSASAQEWVPAATVNFGTLTYEPSNLLASFGSDVNGYSQTVFQNSNSGVNAARALVVTNDIGTDTEYFADFGITSSTYGNSYDTFPEQANSVFLTANGGFDEGDPAVNLNIGVYRGSGSTNIIYNEGLNAYLINTAGALSPRSAFASGVVTTDFGTVGYVLTSAGNNAPPIWQPSSGGGAYLPLAGGTLDAGSKVTFASSTTSNAGLSLGATLGTAPTSPVQGDIWTTSTGAAFIATNSVSQQFITSAPQTDVTIQPSNAGTARTISITAGTATTASGSGGAFILAAGQGASGGNGGTLTLRGGLAGSGGANGAVSIGETNTASIGIGAAGVTSTFGGRVVTPALTISAAGFNIAPTSATPTTLVNGDLWTTSAGLFARIGGATQQYGVLGVSNSWTSTNTFSAATVSFGTSANTGTVSLGTGATLSGSTKTVNIGTGGVSGSTTSITIGATAGTSTTTLNGTVSLANALAATSGGTGQASYAVGDLLYADTTTSLGRIADVATGNALISGGVSTAPSWGKIGLTTHVSGTLGVGNGGTNNASLSVTQGTVYYGNGTQLVGLAPGTSGQFLQTQGASANPQWASVPAQPYDFASRFVGTPVASRVLAEWVADRAVTLSTVATATTGWQFWCVNRPATTTTNLLVKKNGSTIATFQFTTTSTLAYNRYQGLLSGSITATTLAVGDFLTVETDTTVDAAFSTPIFTIQGTA
jgi:hypothetical protein